VYSILPASSYFTEIFVVMFAQTLLDVMQNLTLCCSRENTVHLGPDAITDRSPGPYQNFESKES